MVNKKAIFCFRVPRGIIKGKSCALSFRFSFALGRRAGGRRTSYEEAKRNETKTSPSTPAIVVLLVHRNHRMLGPTRPGPARPGPARDRVLQCRFWRDGSGPRCQSVFLGRVRGPSQAIGYSWSPASKLRDTTKRYQG